MKTIFSLLLLLAVLGPGRAPARAQSLPDAPGSVPVKDAPLGDVARHYRTGKQAVLPVITNENLSQLPQLIRETERRALAAGLVVPTLAETEFTRQETEVTCSFSFTAQGGVTGPVGPQQSLDLPEAELSKLDGPAIINGDTLQISFFNGTNWNVSEITVGLTIVKHDNRSTASNFGHLRLVPATATNAPVLKRPDVTLLYHLKGSAAPLTTTAFTEPLGITVASDQEWHWAILQARGNPPH